MPAPSAAPLPTAPPVGSDPTIHELIVTGRPVTCTRIGGHAGDSTARPRAAREIARRVARANRSAFIAYVQRKAGADVRDFRSLHRWSVERRDAFWPAVWRFCGVVAEERAGRDPWDAVGIGLDRMAPPDPRLGPRWFPGARLNFAENLLRRCDAHPALVFRNESGRRRELSYADLHVEVARVAAALAARGVGAGDRVADLFRNLGPV